MPNQPHRHLTRDQRVELSALLRAKKKQKEIAALIGVHPSTICRELARNREERYDARTADARTKARRIAANQRFRKIESNPDLERYVVQKLRKRWSPEQIAGRLRRRFGKTVVCHETIYAFLYAEYPELKRFLRSQKGKYRRRRGTKLREKAREENKKRRIDVRPSIIDARARIGDWEGDTMIGRERVAGILAHVERKSGFCLADKLPQERAGVVAALTARRFRAIPKEKRLTITYDNGSEFADHELIEAATKATVYFAHPYHSWERGTCENTIGLLRQFFPKRMPLATITQKEIDQAVKLINIRPRKRLHYQTPEEVFKNCDLG